MEIRKATIEDLNRIQELNLLLFEKEYKEYDKLLDLDWTFGKVGEKYFRDALTKSNHCAFVVEVDGVVVGYIVGAIEKGENYRKLPKMAALDNIFVLEEYRSKGIGKMLYGEFVKWAKGNGVKRVKVEASPDNVEGIAYYENMGFKGFTITLEGEI
jgi:diamine N-acetyltransferase